MATVKQLGEFVKLLRDKKGETQEVFANRIGTNRSRIAHLEQGERIPDPKLLEKICKDLNIPEDFWKPYTIPAHNKRKQFEEVLSELVGREVSLDILSDIEHEEANKHIKELFSAQEHEKQVLDNFNRCLIFYGVRKISDDFFYKYLTSSAFKNINTFEYAVEKYQKDAIRVFSTFALAYEELNSSNEELSEFIKELSPKDLDRYRNRNDWNSIIQIPDEDLSNLGYIAAEKVEKEEMERQDLIDFLQELVEEFSNKNNFSQHKILVNKYNVKKLNKMDSLLRKFNSTIEHGFMSSLFEVDISLLEIEIERLAPKQAKDIIVMRETQEKAFANLTNYLTADYMDLYIATSMRNEGDFISVNNFVNNLIKHNEISDLKLRYFNPTQSWIEDRIGKGLIEALMLKRSSVTIYMAQKSDTFGKDSEASVALGQGKPVIVYVPKIKIPEIDFDSSEISKLSDKDLLARLESTEAEDGYDRQALLSSVIEKELQRTSKKMIEKTIKTCWAELDLESEVERIKVEEDFENDVKKKKEEEQKKEFRQLIEDLKDEKEISLSDILFENIKKILLPVIINYEKRAKIFMEVHPLALQVILSTGVLNGILVVRSLDSCAYILKCLLKNEMDLKLQKDDDNYKLIETTTGSIIRVISKNILLGHSFEQFYKYNESIE
jgi:transcriptional regulator with XRE-family HTH domain